jgi:menaquinone-9 beta-reductase
MKYDVAIVGAGPGGTSVAIRLARAGFSVVLIEKAKFPRQKLCGEFISPECLPHFDELGVGDEVITAGGVRLARTVFYGHNGKGVEVKSEWFGGASAEAVGLSRAAMDNCLLQRAMRLGIDVIEGSAHGIVLNGDRVSGIQIKDKQGSETTVEATITVDASGRGRVLARHLTNGNGTPAKFVAFKTHVHGARISEDTCEIWGYRGGYGGSSLVEGSRNNLCFIVSSREVKRVGSDANRLLREVVCANPRAAEVLSDAVAVEPWLAVPIERYGRSELVPMPGLLTVGDAAAFIDPFTGSGILMALESGKILAKAISENASSFDGLSAAYRAAYAAAFDRRLRTSAILRRAAFVPFAAELTVAVLALSSRFRRRIVRATR